MDDRQPDPTNGPTSNFEVVTSDVESFDRVLAQHTGAIRLYVRSLLPGYEGADDIAQETLLKLWQKRDDFQPGTNFKAWAFQIAKFLVMNQRRKLARSKVVLLDDEIIERLDQHWLAADAVVMEPELEALRFCMESLKPEDQKLLHARYATEVSLETYAEKLGTPPGTLKARLFRLRDALRGCIESRLALL